MWSSALPPAQGSALSSGDEPSVLPWRSRVCGASVPHLLLAALPPVGGVFNAGPPDTPAHPVWAQQWLPWQQLCSHNAHLQKRQSATGEGRLCMWIKIIYLAKTCFLIYLFMVTWIFWGFKRSILKIFGHFSPFSDILYTNQFIESLKSLETPQSSTSFNRCCHFAFEQGTSTWNVVF